MRYSPMRYSSPMPYSPMSYSPVHSPCSHVWANKHTCIPQNENKALRESGNKNDSLVYGLIDLLLILQPNLVINNIASPSFKLEPHFTTHPNATLLFADISGYTALAQALGAAGAHGTEMLSQSLDDFFGKRSVQDDETLCDPQLQLHTHTLTLRDRYLLRLSLQRRRD